jgi:hypothetical protein
MNQTIEVVRRKETTEKETISLPFFAINKPHGYAYKIIDEKTAWRITLPNTHNYHAISKTSFSALSTELGRQEMKEISENDFNEYWIMALSEVLPSPKVVEETA